MAASTSTANQNDFESFHAHLKGSKRVVALLGAGLSASSGLPTFRGAGGLWRTHVSTDLATPEAFAEHPGLVWQFYNYRRHMSLSVEPNPAHHALARLSKKMPDFITLSQNVDGLSQRANHPPEQLQLLHGTLFELKCASRSCEYRETNFTDPVVPALAIPTDGVDPTSTEARKSANSQLEAQAQGKDLDISDEKVPLPFLTTYDLPHCPKCKKNLLRPGVVWFGESLPGDVLGKVHDYLNQPEKIDLIMARAKGARVCVVNMDANDAPPGGWKEGDWLFAGDAAVLVPELLKPIIGDVRAKA
ncbi:uncharacterized protein LTR77_007720 [Saxophila tyrrhenica]|uniref:Deacetylase sirtuin-type domain-containing protein n=1 Tax=Saxophila tyrrhenica TaxID=1690608 RepID=A0AAV9P2V8_9PEZI|nr:hypothetical protein LTR77_007720 [Saxophila tyrrhenica]